jgi:hypothetical protein
VIHIRVIAGTWAWPLGSVVHGHQRCTEPQKREPRTPVAGGER